MEKTHSTTKQEWTKVKNSFMAVPSIKNKNDDRFFFEKHCFYDRVLIVFYFAILSSNKSKK